ncbi:SANT/Myb domain [Plasmopara halstedii]|uniref:SANT/Myb domain n=1 Tax=Plasmopara halstedii TaxID=4781 RepID=A0A0P1AVI3_PLAHL|nr:SANT/Myb domain [Plasmopara halstedii]CEG44967.1 SANT/Myb domain [Plasmopara halstedii]|eukprot:XP_024581336.1 SANT/Myb domain [Plasmopara halstedii]
MREKRVALEYCGEFLCHIGALEEANAISEILRKIGVELSDTSPYRLRALLAAIRQELDVDAFDVVFVFERLVQLKKLNPSCPSNALFNSPLFFHLLVLRFAVAFENLDEELFKLESDDLCHTEGIYETCLVLQDTMKENRLSVTTELTKFLVAFANIFKQDEPKSCWDSFYEMYCLKDAAFRRDMKRALWVIESVMLGPTKLELVLPAEVSEETAKVVPRAILEKRFSGTHQEWQDLAQIHSIPDASQQTISDDVRRHEQNQDRPQSDRRGQSQPQHKRDQDQDFPQEEQKQDQDHEQDLQEINRNVNSDATESMHSDNSEESPEERKVVSVPLRTPKVTREARQEDDHVNPLRRNQRDDADSQLAAARRRKRPRRGRWSVEEEAALIEGYRLYHSYANVWVLIKLKYPDVLRLRSNVDLKDKYRNMVKYGKLSQVDNSSTGVTDNDMTDDNSGADGQTRDK